MKCAQVFGFCFVFLSDLKPAMLSIQNETFMLLQLIHQVAQVPVHYFRTSECTSKNVLLLPESIHAVNTNILKQAATQENS